MAEERVSRLGDGDVRARSSGDRLASASGSLGWLIVNHLRVLMAGAWCAGCIAVALCCRLLTGTNRIPHYLARRHWAPVLTRIARADVRVHGLELLEGCEACLFVLNHQSVLDVPVAIQSLPQDLYFVAKRQLKRVPLLGRYIQTLGMVLLPRESRREALAALRAARSLLETGHSLVSFPEGTRSTDGTLKPFKTGVFVPAIEAGVPIVPVAVMGTSGILPPDRFRPRSRVIQVLITEPIATTPLAPSDRRHLAAECRARVERLLASTRTAPASRHGP